MQAGCVVTQGQVSPPGGTERNSDVMAEQSACYRWSDRDEEDFIFRVTAEEVSDSLLFVVVEISFAHKTSVLPSVVVLVFFILWNKLEI